MGLFDPAQTELLPQPGQSTEQNSNQQPEQEQEVSPAVTSDYAYGLDTHAAVNNERSIFDNAYDVVTKGIPLTGLQVINSFANTGIELANVFGANTDKWSIASETGEDSDLNQYYEQHKQGIDLTSFVLGSLIPGGLAVKGLKAGTAALRASAALSEAGESSTILARATGLLPSVRQAKIVEQATQDITSSGSLFNTLTAEKTKAIALGFGDQALQALAYETATAATMKASPILDDKSFGETIQNIGYGALFGAGIGGVLEGIGTRAIFNKMIQGADNLSKAQQIYTKLGMGSYEAGDKVNAIIHSIYNMPEPVSGLGSLFAKRTGEAGLLEAKAQLGSLVPKGDEELTNGLVDVIHKMAQSGTIPEDQAYETFARLAKVQRITSDVVPQVDDGSFFISKRASRSGNNVNTDWNSLVSKASAPAKDADLTLRYTLRPGAIEAKVGNANDTFFDVNGDPSPVYKNSADAFNQGVDLWVNPKGDIIINPKAPNIQQLAKTGESRVLSQQEELALRAGKPLPEGSKPLFASKVDIGDKPGATIVNLKTGAVTDSAIPTIGDHGSLKYSSKGMSYGEGNFSSQELSSEINTDTKTVDASARYAWFTARGIKSGDDLSSTDIPALETLWRNVGSGKLDEGTLKKVTVDGEEVPEQSDLLDMIQEAKLEQINSDVNRGLGAEESALRANVPQDYMRDFEGDQPEDFMNPADYHSTATHAQLWYDIGNLAQQDGNLLKGIRDTQYRVQLIKSANQDAATAFFGPDADNFLIKGSASDAGLTNAPGSGFVSFSSSKYNSFGQEFERTGRMISAKNQDDILKVNQALAAPAIALRQDTEAAAEAGMFRAVRQRNGEQWTWLPQELADKYLPGGQNNNSVAVMVKSLVKDEKTGAVTDWNPNYLPKGFVDATKTQGQTQGQGLRNYYALSPKVADWERANQMLNDERIVHKNNFKSANGLNERLPTGTLYTPPIDTGKFPYFAYVKAREGTGLADDSVGIITAQSQGELQQKIAQLNDQYSIYTKTGSELSLKKFHEVEGDYQYDKNFAQNRVATELTRKGILNDVLPETRAQNIIQDYTDWHYRQAVGLNRDYVELMNGQLFAELRAMGDRFSSTASTKAGYIPPILQRQTPNPYQSYINTALNVSDKDQYRLWNETNQVAESLFSTAFNALRSGFQSARNGILPYDKASDLAEKFGLGKIYESATKPLQAYEGIANRIPQGKELSKFVGAANTILGTGIIRLDAYQSLIHAITTPILAATEIQSIRSQVLKGLITTGLPGTDKVIPATTKLLYQAVKNFWNRDTPEIAKYADLYDSLGADKTILGIHSQMMDQLALPYGQAATDLGTKISQAADLGAKLSGSNFTNTFNHFIASDVGRQIFEALGFEGKDLTNQIMTFTNRVQGNYIAAQRPIAFQGPLGQAFGLFQTFGLNMLQNLFRYVENGEGKTLGLLAGLNTTFFGMQGLPGFNFINTHLVGNAVGNTHHDDLYSGIASGLGAGRGTLGDYLLYGVTSNWLDANLFSRGDISPRNISIFPSSIADVPAIRAGINVTQNLVNFGERLANGAGLIPSFLLAVEHNGLNRPLSGLAQLAQGFATNANGQVIGTTQGIPGNSELINFGNFSRLLGARPLDEAVALNVLNRFGMYTAKDEARINNVGMAAKTELYAGGELAPEEVSDFAARYSAAGGNVNKFNSTISRWTSQANAVTANKVFKSLRNTGAAQNAMIEMGGQQLPDYRNTAIETAGQENSTEQ